MDFAFLDELARNDAGIAPTGGLAAGEHTGTTAPPSLMSIEFSLHAACNGRDPENGLSGRSGCGAALHCPKRIAVEPNPKWELPSGSQLANGL